VPPVDLVYPTGIWHYARGLALARQGKLEQAQRELIQLRQIVGDPAVANLTIFDLNSVVSILQIAEAILAGEIAVGHGDDDTAVKQLQEAIRLEDELNYTEPKDWYLPPPQNGWVLFGLVQSLRAQGKDAEANSVSQEFKQAWADADVTLTSSRF